MHEMHERRRDRNRRQQDLDRLKYLSRMCWEEAQKPRWIKNLLRMCWADREHKNFLDRLRFLSRMIEKNLLRIYQEVVKLEENRFFKKGKTHKDECNKQATQTKSNQHIKLSKNLSTKKMQSILDPKHTLTH